MFTPDFNLDYLELNQDCDYPGQYLSDIIFKNFTTISKMTVINVYRHYLDMDEKFTLAFDIDIDKFREKIDIQEEMEPNPSIEKQLALKAM